MYLDRHAYVYIFIIEFYNVKSLELLTLCACIFVLLRNV